MHIRIILFTLVAGCSDFSKVGSAPDFSDEGGSHQYNAIHSQGVAAPFLSDNTLTASSLWSSNQSSLLGDRRASARGDILTAVIQIDDRAELASASNRSRAGQADYGLPSIITASSVAKAILPTGSTAGHAFDIDSSSKFSGSGKVSRQEKITLRIAASVIEVLPNGTLRIEGSQELRLNNELRQLTISGYIRASDISRQNEIQYDKIAAAKVSYGGRGLVSDFQTPKMAQRILDSGLPF